jgi:PEP-CTERM motif-containing protein
MLRVVKSIALLWVLSGVVCADSRIDFTSETASRPAISVSRAGTGLLAPDSEKVLTGGQLRAAAQHPTAESRLTTEDEGFSLAVPEPGTLGLLGTGLLGIAGLLRRKRRK